MDQGNVAGGANSYCSMWCVVYYRNHPLMGVVGVGAPVGLSSAQFQTE